MKTLNQSCFIVTFIIFLTYSTSVVDDQTNFDVKPSKTNTASKASKHIQNQVVSSIGLKVFLDKLAQIESRGKAWIVSSTGYLGKYQFNMKTIKGLGFEVTQEEFLNNEMLQDSVVIAYLHHNKRVLNKYIQKYDGQVVDSVYITKAGILAAAHLVGPGGVITFLTQDSQFSTTDGNGVSARKYLQIFSKYRLKEI